MRFRHELSYEAPRERVFAMLADPESRRRSCEAVEVTVPLIGGELERLMAELMAELTAEKVTAGMDVEHAVGVAWLEEH